MTTYEMVRTKAEAAHRAAGELAVTSTVIKNKALLAMADALEAGAAEILAANAKDMEAGRANNMKESMLDRLALSPVCAHMAADIAVSFFHKSMYLFFNSFRAVAVSVAVNSDPLPAFSSEQTVERHSRQLSFYIPEGFIHP